MLKYVKRMLRKCKLKLETRLLLLVILLSLTLYVVYIYLINKHNFSEPNCYSCSPKTNIVFLKTHKSAGSSIQNILMRYGYSHNLSFVLPKKHNYIGHPALFNRTMVLPSRHLSYNILTHHTRLNYQEIQSIMNKDSIYITIVRDPIEIFESMYSYYNMQTHLKTNLHKFTSRIPYMNRSSLHKRYLYKFGSNQMMYDLGADPKIFCNETLIKQYLNKLDSWFDLVLVADRMNESLVLLRRLLCWELDDVIAFKLNARDLKFKSRLNEKEKSVLRQLNHADVLLYNHFVQKFEKAIDDIGRDRIKLETQALRNRTQEWYNLCIKQEQLGHRIKPKYNYSHKVILLVPNATKNDTCKWMTMEELPYTDILRKKQQKLKSVASTSGCFIHQP